jgi:ABC-type transporter Mla MlaB component
MTRQDPGRLTRMRPDADCPAPPPAFAIRVPIARSDLPGLYARVCALLEACAGSEVACEVAGPAECVDAVAVEALARLQLAARRHGCLVRLRTPPDSLRELLALAGLDGILPG